MFLRVIFSFLAVASCHAAYGSLRGERRHKDMALIQKRIAMLQSFEGSEMFAKSAESARSGLDDAPDVSKEIKRQYNKGLKDLAKTYKKAVHEMDSEQIEDMIKEDTNRTMNHLMPGKRPDFRKKLIEMILTVVAILWFWYYFGKVYKNDRIDNSEPWHLEGTPQSNSIKNDPDFVMVFYNPGFKYSDNDTVVPSEGLNDMIVADQGKLPRMDAYFERHACSLKTTFGKTLTSAFKKQVTGELKGRTYQHVREALIQDVCENLSNSGFDVSVFQSVDHDELFVCISLVQEESIQHHLAFNSMKLQIQKDVVKAMDVDQPDDEPESSPPLVVYDSKLATNILGSEKSDKDFYHNYDGPGGTTTILSSTHRINTIISHMFRLFNLDMAMRQGLLVNWFPCHSEKQIADFHECWAKWRMFKDLSCVQPLAKINEYFGPRVALLFAWNAVYAKALLGLLPPALLFEFVNLIFVLAGRTDFWNRGSVLGFSIVLAVWCRLAMNTCAREEEYLISMWDVKDSAHTNLIPRADFFGDYETSKIDGNEVVLAYPAWKHNLRLVASWAVTVLFCGFNLLVITVWYDNFNGVMNPFASVILSGLIVVFTQIFNWMGQELTIHENHTLPATFYKSYLQKMVIFQCVNRYLPFFYIAVKQQFTVGGCPAKSCVGQIAFSMPITLFCLMACRCCTVVAYSYVVDFMLWFEDYQMRRKGEEPPKRSYVEQQGKYVEFGDREQVEVTVELVLALGFILLFGSISPRIVPMCLMVFLVQLRAIAVMLTRSAQRTVPRKTFGIGPMRSIVTQLMYIGVVFTAYLLVQFGPLFRDTRTLTKVTGFVCHIIVVVLIWGMVDLVCPPHSESSDILEGRREYVVNKLCRRNSEAMYEAQASTGKRERRASYTGKSGHRLHEDKVFAGQWNEIPGSQ